MRDPRRIQRVLTALSHYWYRYPDLRLGQIIGNFSPYKDAYHFEDDALADALEAAMFSEAPYGVPAREPVPPDAPENDKTSHDPTQRAEATTTPEGAKGWVYQAGSAQVLVGGHGLDVAPDASPGGSERRPADEQHGGGKPSSAPLAAVSPDARLIEALRAIEEGDGGKMSEQQMRQIANAALAAVRGGATEETT